MTAANNKHNAPIGVFDSGLGGLTLVNALRSVLPSEDIIYFGDTAHLPYGDKSSAAIRHYSEKISSFLLEHNCKLILIACNTASAYAYESVVSLVKNKALVLNVIDPIIDHICQSQKYGKLGIIGTKGTVSSGTYPKKLLAKLPSLQVSSLATPLLVPMIEEGFVYDDISNAIIRAYLSNEQLQGIDSLILGCTHYPLIKNQIRKFYDFRVNVIDSSKIVAMRLQAELEQHQLLSDNGAGSTKFFVSDFTPYFKRIAEMFFEDTVELEHIDFWK